jgi:hypothetical protein
MNTTISNGIGTADLVPTLLEITEKKIWPQLQRSHYMWNRFFQKRGVEVNSRSRQIPLYLRPGQVGTFRAEGLALPFAGPELEVKASFGYTKYQRGFSFSAESLEEMKQSSSLLSEADRLDRYRVNIKTELARFFYGSGDSSVAVVGSVSVTTGADGSLLMSVTSGNLGTSNMEIGSYYQILDSSNSNAVLTWGGVRYFKLVVSNAGNGGGTQTTSGTLAAFHTPSSTVPNFAAATAVAAGDLIVPVGSVVGGTSYGFHGLGYHVVESSATTWQGLTLSSYPELRSIVKDASSADLTLGLANFIEDVVIFRRDQPMGGEDKSLIITSPGQHARLKQYLNSLRRATMGEKTMSTGGKEVENQLGNKWEVDPHCPDDRVYHLKEDDFSMLVLKELSFVDNGSGGNMVLRRDDSDLDFDNYSHIYDGWWTMMFEFVSREPRNQAMIKGLGTTGIVRKHSYFR